MLSLQAADAWSGKPGLYVCSCAARRDVTSQQGSSAEFFVLHYNLMKQTVKRSVAYRGLQAIWIACKEHFTACGRIMQVDIIEFDEFASCVTTPGAKNILPGIQ